MIKSVRSLTHFPQSLRHQRWLSSAAVSSESKPLTTEDGGRPKKTSPDTEYRTTAAIEPVPIQSLNIRSRIETYRKVGSSFKNLFLGMADTDLLNFPFLLRSRKEFLTMAEQYAMIRNTWNQIRKDDETLNLLNYNSLYKLSVSEMMYIFEAIGASVEKSLPFGAKEDAESRFEKRLSKTFDIQKEPKTLFDLPEAAFASFHSLREAIETVVPLIERNAIVYYAMSRSSNPHVQKLLESNNQTMKVAFAFDEDFAADRTDIRVNQWTSEARLAFDYKSWVINGRKNNIIDGPYTHYLVVTKTNDFTEVQVDDKLQNDVGILALLVPADQIKIEAHETDHLAIRHQLISFDCVELLRDQCEVINATKNLADFDNVKGCGQLAVSAFILGLLKQLQKNTYAHLINHRIGLTNCEIVQYKLFNTTCHIYALESMIYLTAAMFDSFERGANIGSETMATKIHAIQNAYDVVGELRSLFGSRYPFSSTVYDLIHYMDSYLDNTLNSRICLASDAVKHYETFQEHTLNRLRFFPKQPIHMIKQYLKQRKLRKNETFLTREMTKYIHHNLHTACDWIEHLINLLQFSMYYLSNLNPKKKLPDHVYDLNRLVEMSIDIQLMISCLSRANHSLCYGIRNGAAEKDLCMAICKQLFLKHLQTFEAIDKRTLVDNDDYCQQIFEMNLQQKGYFPKLFQVDHQ